MASQRANWTGMYEKGLVDVLLEHKGSQYRGQNGWSSKGWNRIVRDVNKVFPDEKFTKSQIQDKEYQFKKSYKAITSIVNRSGVSWNPISFTIDTTAEKWDEIIEEDSKLRKYKKNSFPLYDSLVQLYEGQFAKGKHCFTSIRAPDLDDSRVEIGSKSTSSKCPGEETQQDPQRKDSSTSLVLNNETFDVGKYEVGGRSYGQPMPQGLHEEDLDDDEVDTDLQAPRSEAPSNSSNLRVASQRAKWTGKYEKGLVDVLLEYKGSQYRGQNGWCTEGLNRIVRDVNKLFPDEKFTKSQIQDKESQFKKSYKEITSIVNRSGVSWNPISFTIDTSAEKWDEIIEEDSKLRKYKNNSLPLYDSLDQFYEGQFAKGKHCFTSIRAPDLDDSRVEIGSKSTSSKCPGEETQQDPQRKDSSTSLVLNNETFDDGKYEVGGRSYGQPMPQGLHGEDLHDDEVDTDLQAPRSEEPSNSSNVRVASQRAKWAGKFEKGLVDVLLEYKGSQYRGQNGWCTEGWNRIVRDVNKLFPDEKFTKSQIQDKEAQFKKGYKAIKSIVNRSGVSWNPISCMINTTKEKWGDIIKEDPKFRKYENRSFPLYDSWDQLYEGQFAEGKHCSTSIRDPDLDDLRVETGSKSTSWKRPREETHQVPQRKNASTSKVLHNETLGDRRDEVGGRSYGQPMAQGLHEEDLDDDEVDVDLQAPRSVEPLNSRSVDCCTNGRPKKRKDGSVPCLDETISAYIDLKIAQTSSREQAMTQGQGQEYSMSRCFEVLHSMDDVSDDIMVLASDVFKDPVNREIFMCYQPRFRGLWLRKEVAKLDVPGFRLR